MYLEYTIGRAGTGKSYELIKQLEQLDPNKTLVLAPTHKALRVLSERLEDEAYTLSTIHSFLGWVPGVNELAEHVNQVDITHKLERAFENEVTHIIVDEFSMMSEEMLFELTSKIEEATDYESEHISLHLYGDPYQLPPVKASPIYTDPATTTHLTVQHRAESKDIPELFEKFVDYLEGNNTKDLSIPESEHVSYVSSFKGFKRGDRALAYTNATVGTMNKEIAQLLGFSDYQGTEVQLGNMPETIIVDTYLYPTKDDLLGYYEAGKLALQNSQINKKFLDHTMHSLATDLAISFVQDTAGIIYPVLAGIGDAYLLRNQIKEKAANASKGSPARSKAWQRYYTINRAFTMDFSFASTVHKSQGSEFNTVWIHKSDMLKAIGPTRNYQQYARLMYVALSRAVRQVNIVG